MSARSLLTAFAWSAALIMMAATVGFIIVIVLDHYGGLTFVDGVPVAATLIVLAGSFGLWLTRPAESTAGIGARLLSNAKGRWVSTLQLVDRIGSTTNGSGSYTGWPPEAWSGKRHGANDRAGKIHSVILGGPFCWPYINHLESQGVRIEHANQERLCCIKQGDDRAGILDL